MRAYPCRSANAPSELPPALVLWPRPYRRGEGPIVGVRVGLTILLAASVLLSLVTAAVWLFGAFPERAAVGQTLRDPTIIAPPPRLRRPKRSPPLPARPPPQGWRTSSVMRPAEPPRAPRRTIPQVSPTST